MKIRQDLGERYTPVFQGAAAGDEVILEVDDDECGSHVAVVSLHATMQTLIEIAVNTQFDKMYQLLSSRLQ